MASGSNNLTMNTQPTQQHPQPTPAPTPRTDAAIQFRNFGSGHIDWVSVKFARTLERELTEARATLLAREGELDSMSAALAAKDREIAELARLKSENESLRTLWTEARDVVTQGRNANCIVSYGKAQCDAVAAANAWLDKMPATVKRTIDDASNTEWQLQRVTAERDQLRAELAAKDREIARLGDEHLKESLRHNETMQKLVDAEAQRDALSAEVERLGKNIAAIETAGGDEGASARMAMETVDLRTQLAAGQQDAERYRHLRVNWDHWTGATWSGNVLEIAAQLDAAIDAARGKGQP